MQSRINTSVYDTIGEGWYTGQDTPFALLRAEAKLRNPWLLKQIKPGSKVLDIGCGGGLLSNDFAAEGCNVTAVDLSEASLTIARAKDATGRVRYLYADALALPFEESSFDAVAMMDFLEHVEKPAQAIAEAARVLRPGGQLFFYTFNRTLASWLLAVKGIDWIFKKSAPKNIHSYQLLIKPEELVAMCRAAGLRPGKFLGMRPRLRFGELAKLLLKGIVSESFEFQFTASLKMGYLGICTKENPSDGHS